MRGQVSFCCFPDCRSMIVYLIILCIIYASFFPIFPALKMPLLVALVACGRHGVQSLMEMSCKSTIKQEVSTLPGTSINRNMTCWFPVKPREDMIWHSHGNDLQATSAKSNPNLICSQSSQRSDWHWYTLIIFDQHLTFVFDGVVVFAISTCFEFRPPRPPCRRSRPVASGRCQNPSATSLARARRLTQRRGTVSGHDFHLWQFAWPKGHQEISGIHIDQPFLSFSSYDFVLSMISPYVSTLKLRKARNTNAGRMARSRPTKYAKPCLSRLHIWSRLPR